jgi:hypothetical protein
MTSHLGTYRVGQMMPLFAVMVGAVDLLLTNKHRTAMDCWIKWYTMHFLCLLTETSLYHRMDISVIGEHLNVVNIVLNKTDLWGVEPLAERTLRNETEVFERETSKITSQISIR